MAHTGAIDAPGFAPPLTEAWRVSFGRGVSYPVIADGRVFVSAGQQTDGGPNGETMRALDLRTGAELWRANVPGPNWDGLEVYDGGRVFEGVGDGSVRAFDAATGNLVWTSRLA